MTKTPLPPEAQLILLCAGGERNQREFEALLRADLDWHAVLALASNENSARPLWRMLARAGDARVPDEVRDKLEKLSRVWEFRMIHLESLLHRTVRAFDEHEIDVLLLKGAGLAYTTYDSFADRPMYDLDLLVEPEQADEAWQIARAHGWRWDPGEYPQAQYVGHHHLPPLADGAGSGTRLEIHTDLCRPGHPFTLCAQDIWKSSEVHMAGDLALRIPARTHQILHTCLHFAWGHAMRLKAFACLRDICTYLERGQLVAEELVPAARATGTDSCAYWTLRIARSAAGAPVPDAILAALRPELPELVLGRLERHIVLHLLPLANQCPSARTSKLLHRIAIGRDKTSEEAMEILGVSPEYALPATARQPASMGTRIGNQLRHLAVWRRYLGTVLGR